MSKVSSVNAELKALVTPGINITVADGMAKSVTEKGMFIKNLPSEITEEQALIYEGYRSEYMGATAAATADLSLPIFQEHKNITSIAVDFPLVGKDNWSVGIERSHDYPNPKGGEGTTTLGAMTFKLETHAARGSRGVLKQVREETAAAYLAALGGK